MRIAVTGTSGRVGAALAKHFQATHEVIPLPRSGCDLADGESLAAVLKDLECDVFLNPAGITSLEDCEDDPALAMRVNAEAPAEIADWATARGVPMFHLSTDYVFNSDMPRRFSEHDAPDPVSTYGRSKLAGENEVLARPGHCVIRISWVYGPEKPSFVDRVFDDALAGNPLAGIADKFSLPVLTTDLAEWIENLIEKNTTGIIHACQSGEPASWHDMAVAVVEEMVSLGLLSKAPLVCPQTLAASASFRARRPRYSAMATDRLTAILGQPPRHWRDALTEYIRLKASLR
jgi:dTDP-4-dehydrorhamnose reductase